jgi:hypothetical protein
MELLSFPSITPTEKEAIVFLLSRMTYLTITPAIENETIDILTKRNCLILLLLQLPSIMDLS